MDVRLGGGGSRLDFFSSNGSWAMGWECGGVQGLLVGEKKGEASPICPQYRKPSNSRWGSFGITQDNPAVRGLPSILHQASPRQEGRDLGPVKSPHSTQAEIQGSSRQRGVK